MPRISRDTDAADPRPVPVRPRGRYSGIRGHLLGRTTGTDGLFHSWGKRRGGSDEERMGGWKDRRNLYSPLLTHSLTCMAYFFSGEGNNDNGRGREIHSCRVAEGLTAERRDEEESCARARVPRVVK